MLFSSTRKSQKRISYLRNSLGTSLARVQLRIVSPTSPSFNSDMLDLCYNQGGNCGNHPNTFQRRRQLSLGTLGRAENGLMQLGAKELGGGGGGGGQESPDQEQGGQQGQQQGPKRWSNPGPTRGEAAGAGRAGLRLVLPTVVIAAPTPYDNCNR